MLAALVGVLGGAVVAGMGIGVDILHEVFFQLSPGERLSGRLSLDPWLAVLIPLGGGIIFGIASEVIAGGGRSGRSIRSKPTRCTAAACRSSAA